MKDFFKELLKENIDKYYKKLQEKYTRIVVDKAPEELKNYEY